MYTSANQTDDDLEETFAADDEHECGNSVCAAAYPQPQNAEDGVISINDHQNPWSFFPSTVVAILLTETAEKFSYYGFRAILVLYLTKQLNFTESTAISLFAYMTSFATLMPLFGAVISDGYLGKYMTILIFSSIYAVGIGILTGAAYASDVTFTFIGLFLICVGTGGIKPCVSPFGADQLNNVSRNDGANEQLVQKYFSYYYLGVNVGALASFLLMPSIRARFGFSAAFFSSASFMIFALVVFVSKKSEYVMIKPGDTNHLSVDADGMQRQGTKLTNVMRIYIRMVKIELISRILCNRGGIYYRTNVNAGETDRVGDEDRDTTTQNGFHGMSQQEVTDAKEVLRVLPVLAAFPAFWMLYDQLGSVWTLQANNMNLHGIQPEQLGVLNPLLILVFIPLFDQHIYPWCQRRGWSIEPLRRMACGMLLIAISFFMSGLLEAAVEKGDSQANAVEAAGNNGDGYRIDIWWQVPQIIVISTAEILVSVTGLEFVYANSPHSMKSVIMAMYSLTFCIGDLFGGLLYSCLANVSRDVLLHICGLLMLVNLVVFKRFVESWWNKGASIAEQDKAKGRNINEDTEIELPPLS
mmetsp:Transcript_12692/g.19127  ORF Transcript_12692/g.19127 Transcript_12692/m.19127 type:complete len:584 (-) Transcript_12692:181-1932(-)|eukprot:CAMPEP_0196822330 /NCGR_PEP_ID=MMETSP1362-20130617/83037_1 /TAXON_ID=163516 /ORGANISM="Leptocylindrus danicus, Strain CCMP1856" /LENGTH=583 /DNA_ID=CAMNT_0042201863 /DNA_START=88 /DNA_END=1839 /DNA_ORIENTATION=+